MNLLVTKNSFFTATFIMVVLFGSLFFDVGSAYAQFSGGRDVRIFLSLNPEHPQPGESVRITADSPLIDISQSDIVWYVNDKAFAQNPGQKEVDIILVSLGSETHVSAVARTQDGTSASGEVFIRPAVVDLLWESDSFVPPFYRGRALPSAGTFIRANAIVHFEPAETLQTPERDIIYTWKRNGSLVQSVSGRGKSSAVFPSPTLFGTDTIEVVASALGGAKEGGARVVIPSIEPVLTLYKNHPLFGISYNQALEEAESMPDTEMSFSAVPYFAEAEGPNDPALNYSWSINGIDIGTDESRRNALTINADKSNGLARIALSVTHAVNLFMQSSGSWEVTLGASNQ